MNPSSILIPIFLLISFFSPQAQSVQLPPRNWFIEPKVKLAWSGDDPAMLYGVQLGKTDEDITVAVGLCFLTKPIETRIELDYDRIQMLAYLGANIEFETTLFSTVKIFWGGSLCVGGASYELVENDIVLRADGFFVGAEPEAGLLIKPLKHLEIKLATSYIAGAILGLGEGIAVGPTASLGIRLIKYDGED